MLSLTSMTTVRTAAGQPTELRTDMSLQLAGVVTGVFGITVGALMIVSTLLHRAGITWFISPRGFKKRPVPVGAYLLAGAGLVLQGGMQMIPAEHRSVWALWLVLVIFIASLVLLAISLRKPELDRPEHD